MLEGALDTPPNYSSLVTLWQQQRNSILRLGRTLHERIPPGEPEVTIHGRDLDPETEGVGFQFQLTMNGELYDGRFRAGYFVVQVQLVKRKTSLGWLVDGMPILEVEHANYDLYSKRSHSFAYRDHQGLEGALLDNLAQDAAGFFQRIRTGEPPPEPATPFGGERTSPVL
jgi:hypothetical protein